MAMLFADEIGRQIAVAELRHLRRRHLQIVQSVVPNRTDTILVTSTEYDDAGQAYKTN